MFLLGVSKIKWLRVGHSIYENDETIDELMKLYWVHGVCGGERKKKLSLKIKI